MLKRILSAALFIPLVVFAIFETASGGVIFLALLLACAFLTGSEYFDLLDEHISRASRIFGIASIVGAVSLCFILGASLKGMTLFLTQSEFSAHAELPEVVGMIEQFSAIISLRLFAIIILFLVLCLMVFFLIQIRRSSFEGAFRDIAVSFFAVPYIGFGFGSLAILHALPGKGSWLVLLAFVIVWVTDSFAYFIGRIIGRHPLGLAASPKKTIEGTLAGLLFAVAAAAGLKLIFPEAYQGWAWMSWPQFLILAFVLSVVDQIGDLAESVLKRSLGTKDSGALVPGHGGLLDVFDAQLLVSPLMLGLVILLAGL
ncbi:MAG: phosphatidate cytidylyltransferase [Spirochaetota bacterium]|nr:phosphatidate cytidylyltransferase [Spirochaetota bacterium]